MPTPKLTKLSANRGASPTLRIRNGSFWKKIGMCVLDMGLLLLLGGLLFSFFLSVQDGKNGSEPAGLQITKSKEQTIAKDSSFSSSPSSITYQKVKSGEISGYAKGDELQYEMFAAVDSKTSEPISVKQWAQLMAHSPDASLMAKDITKIIQDTSYPGVFFETKGVSVANADKKQFEFVIIDGVHLAIFAEPNASLKAFAEHLICTDDEFACQFQNLGGDATLVAPKKYDATKEDKVYSHLAAFLRGAPEAQVLHIWQKVAAIYEDMLQTRDPNKPVWMSTAGEGVHWLHFRFDDTPKYYRYFPFAEEN